MTSLPVIQDSEDRPSRVPGLTSFHLSGSQPSGSQPSGSQRNDGSSRVVVIAVVAILGVMLAIWIGREPSPPAYLELGPETTIYSEPVRDNGAIDYVTYLEPADRFNRAVHSIVSLTDDPRFIFWSDFAKDATEDSPAFLLRKAGLSKLVTTQGRAAMAQWLAAIDPTLIDRYFADVELTQKATIDGHPYFNEETPVRAIGNTIQLLLGLARSAPPQQAASHIGRALEVARASSRYSLLNHRVGLELENRIWRELSFWPTYNPAVLSEVSAAVLQHERTIGFTSIDTVLTEHRLGTLQLILNGWAKDQPEDIANGRLIFDAAVDGILRYWVLATQHTFPLIHEIRDPSVLEIEVKGLGLPTRKGSLAAETLGEPGTDIQLINRARIESTGRRWVTCALLAHLSGSAEPSPPPMGVTSRTRNESGPVWTFEFEGFTVSAPSNPEAGS